MVKSFDLVVAATHKSLGIGANGKMPWRLPGDMAYFKQLTVSTQDPTKRNAVIMGRKTWQSIPKKFRPLPDRVNVVLSRHLESKSEWEIPDDVFVADSLQSAMQLLSMPDVGDLESIYVIGGGTIYQEALDCASTDARCRRIYMTRINQEFDCDTFFPAIDLAKFELQSTSAERRDGDVAYEFLMFESMGSKMDKMVKAPVTSSPQARHPEHQYLDCVRDILETGVLKGDRTGTGTISKFGVQHRWSLRDDFPLLTTKQTFFRGVAEELLWFMSGDTKASTLQEKKIHIWDGNSSREYLDSIGLTEREVGDLGPVYGWQWRHFGAQYKDMHTDYTGQGIDQLAEVVHKIKNKPNDRRIILTAWNPTDIPIMALPPCHMFAQFYVADGALSCQMYQRSADMGLGVPFNIASYALLTCLLAHVCGLERGDFVHCIGDAHVYSNHVEALKVQLDREPRPFPQLHISDRVKNLEDCTYADLKLTGYDPHPKISMKMAV